MPHWNFAFFDSGVRFDQPDAHPTTMRNLSRFLENPFDDPSIGIARLIAFTTDHVQRMIAGNQNGELSARITATNSSLTLVIDCVTDDQTHLGIRKARKQSKDEFRTNLPAAVARLVAAVEAEFGPDSPQVVECIPQGRSVFSSCRDDEVSGHLQTLINGITAHQAQLGAPLVTRATNLKATWVLAYQASEHSSGAKTTSEQGKRLARENLALMLYLNLVKLMEMFPRQPEKLALYMQQSLLEVPATEEEETPAPPAPTPNP